MTITELIHELEVMRAQHDGTLPVCANTDAMLESVRHTWEIVTVTKVEYEQVPQRDGDGFAATNQDGTECFKPCVVLS